jgi:hypothetical protein
MRKSSPSLRVDLRHRLSADFGLAMTAQQTQQIPEVKALIDDPPAELLEWAEQTEHTPAAAAAGPLTLSQPRHSGLPTVAVCSSPVRASSRPPWR